MSQNRNLGDSRCCRPSIPNLRMLTFSDGSQVGITGLDAVMVDLFQEGKKPDAATALEMIDRLQHQNYLNPSASQQYEELFLGEYRSFYESKITTLKKEKENDNMATQENNQNIKKKGIFNLFKVDKKAANEGGCCNMKIVPKEQAAKESTKGGCCNIKIVPKEQSTEGKSSQK